MTGTFRHQVKFDRFVYGYPGRMFRCTVTMRMDTEDGKAYIWSVPGCLVLRKKNGELKFQPVQSNVGSKRFPVFFVSPDSAAEVLRLVAGSKWADLIGSDKAKKTDPTLPAEFDATAPTILGDLDIEPLGEENDGN